MSWPVGAGAKGSDGVAATVQQIPGGIGYDESAYADAEPPDHGACCKNKAGKFVAPTMAAFQAAGRQRRLVEGAELRHRPERPAGRRELADRVRHLRAAADRSEGRRTQSAAVKKFFDWGFAHGSDIATQLLYIPLPESVQDAIRAAWQKEVPGTM